MWFVRALIVFTVAAPAGAGQVLDIAVSVLPQREIVERIGGDAVHVRVLVEPGESPAVLAITPQELADITTADVLLTIGVPFDRALVPQLREIAPGLEILDMAGNVERLPMSTTGWRVDRRGRVESGHAGHDHGGDGEHPEGALDPHVWLDPARVSLLAGTVRDVLCDRSPEHCDLYDDNLAAYRRDLEAVDRRIRDRLQRHSGREICVFHPAYGYFTERYGLRQIAVEVEGKRPSPRQLAALIETFEGTRIGAIFVQPQFNSRSADAVAKAIGADVVELDPLAADLLENLERMAERIAEALSSR